MIADLKKSVAQLVRHLADYEEVEVSKCLVEIMVKLINISYLQICISGWLSGNKKNVWRHWFIESIYIFFGEVHINTYYPILGVG